MKKQAPKHIRYEADLDFVRRFIEDVMMGVFSVHSILNIYAVTAYGKSDFLHKVKGEFQRKLPTTLVHVMDYFDEEQEGGYRLDRMLRRMVLDLQNGLPAWARADSVLDEDWGVTELADQIEEMIHHAVENEKIALILVDDYDRLPPGTRILFDEAVLGRVVEEPGQAVVTLTSEQELTFTDRLDLKVHLETHPLSQFTKEDIKTTIPQYAELAEEILKWTGGLSELVEFLVKELGKHSIDTLEEYHAREKELLKGAYREHVDHVVFDDLPEPVRQAVPILSLLRRFDVSTLRSILPQIVPDFEAYTTRQYLELIDQLGSRVQWREEGGYGLDDALRTILSNYERVYEPTTYKRVHRIAEHMYEDWLRKRYRGYYLKELLYHRLAQEKLSPGVDFPHLVRLVSGKLLEYIEGRCKPGPCEDDDVDELRVFKESLEQDPDLSNFIGPEVWEAIKAKEASIVSRE